QDCSSDVDFSACESPPRFRITWRYRNGHAADGREEEVRSGPRAELALGAKEVSRYRLDRDRQ
ncbi:MAG TPA: hypothetical protein VKU44_11315, partial [Terriglobia bacterium]|nr:hypothetical protein [Terriglobia bacterium]